jgi:hypothetical protein
MQKLIKELLCQNLYINRFIYRKGPYLVTGINYKTSYNNNFCHKFLLLISISVTNIFLFVVTIIRTIKEIL